MRLLDRGKALGEPGFQTSDSSELEVLGEPQPDGTRLFDKAVAWLGTNLIPAQIGTLALIGNVVDHYSP